MLQNNHRHMAVIFAASGCLAALIFSTNSAISMASTQPGKGAKITVDTPKKPADTNMSSPLKTNQTVGNTARDGNVAIREEFDVASGKNTIAAYELFIARHPAHPLSELAGQKLRQLQDQKDQ